MFQTKDPHSENTGGEKLGFSISIIYNFDLQLSTSLDGTKSCYQALTVEDARVPSGDAIKLIGQSTRLKTCCIQL